MHLKTIQGSKFTQFFTERVTDIDKFTDIDKLCRNQTMCEIHAHEKYEKSY